MRKISRKFRFRIRILYSAAVLFAICVIGVPAIAEPIPTQFFVPTDFSASIEVILSMQAGNPLPNESVEEVGTNVAAGLSREVGTGADRPPELRGLARGSVGGTAGLDLGGFAASEVRAYAEPDKGDWLGSYGEVRAGVMNKFVAVPRDGFSGTEVYIRLDVLTEGGMFAEIDDYYHTSLSGGNWVQAGVELDVPGWCNGCLGDYYFRDSVGPGNEAGYFSSKGISDHYTFEGYIPVNRIAVVWAGLSVFSGYNALASLPDGYFSGITGANFTNTLRFGVSSPDPVDFVWASDLFFDRQPSISDQVAVPEPASGMLLMTGLCGLLGAVRRAGRRKA